MGTGAHNLIEEAEHHSTTDEFYWAIAEHMKACRGQADHLDELESAMQWCIDHSAIIIFADKITLQFRYAKHVRVVDANSLLEAIDKANDLMDGAI